MLIYLDTSVVTSLFVVDVHTPLVAAWLRRIAGNDQVTLSDWTLSEFTDAVAASTRAGRVPPAMRAEAEQRLDEWATRLGRAIPVLSEDVREARTLIKATGEALRAPDALHVAIARRHEAALATLDISMRRAAADLGLEVEDL